MDEGLISVVVAARNAERFIGKCLASLTAMDYPVDRFEIIVVDNASTDRTAAIIDEFPVLHVREQRLGTTSARNAGLANARGDIIAFTDADCIVEPDWAAEIERIFEVPEVDAVMGYTDGIDTNFWSRLEQCNYEAFWYRHGVDGMTLRRTGIDTRNSAIRSRVLSALGNFNADLPFCGDLELSVRLRAANCHVAFNPQMRVHHHNRTDLDHILRIKRDHGLAYVQIVAAQPDGLDSPHLPSDVHRYFGIDNRRISGASLVCARYAMHTLSVLLVVALRGLSLFRDTPNRLAVKLFKTLCGIAWETAILDARWRGDL